MPRRQAHPVVVPSSSSNGSISINSQTIGNGNLREAVINAPLPLTVTASAAASSTINTTGASAGGAQSSQIAVATNTAVSTESFQLHTQRLWEEREKLTEEEQSDRDKLNLEKAQCTASVLFKTLWLKDPYKYFLIKKNEDEKEKEALVSQEGHNDEPSCNLHNEIKNLNIDQVGRISDGDKSNSTNVPLDNSVNTQQAPLATTSKKVNSTSLSV